MRQSGRDFLTNTYPLDDGKGVGIDFGVDGGLFREREFFSSVKIYDKHIDIVYRRPMSAKRIYKSISMQNLHQKTCKIGRLTSDIALIRQFP